MFHVKLSKKLLFLFCPFFGAIGVLLDLNGIYELIPTPLGISE
jgi:hypothetical protein